MATSISTARANLYTLLDAATWPGTKPQVAFGAPTAYEEQEVVALLGVTDADEAFAAIGAGRREETYELEVAVKVHDPAASTPQPVDARGFELADTVRGVVHSNYTLTGAVRGAEVRSLRTDGAVAAEGAGFVIFLRLGVACAARIT